MLRVHLDVGREAELITGLQTTQVRFEVSGQRAVVAHGLCQSRGIFLIGEEFEAVLYQNRGLRRKRAGLFMSGSQLSSRDFAGFDIGLIEGINPEDRAGYRGSDLPAEELFAEFIRIGDQNAYHW